MDSRWHSLCQFFRPLEKEPAVSLLSHAASSALRYVFGVAKSQAVSWAHFHMARTRRVKPMSFGFSSPRISRCFIMDVNSLLLSSPFPAEDSWMGEGRRRGGVMKEEGKNK